MYPSYNLCMVFELTCVLVYISFLMGSYEKKNQQWRSRLQPLFMQFVILFCVCVLVLNALLHWHLFNAMLRCGFSFFDEVKGGFPPTSGIKNTILRGSRRETRWKVEARIFLWWPIPDQVCEGKLNFSAQAHTRLCRSPTPTEQATHTGEG